MKDAPLPGTIGASFIDLGLQRNYILSGGFLYPFSSLPHEEASVKKVWEKGRKSYFGRKESIVRNGRFRPFRIRVSVTLGPFELALALEVIRLDF